MSRLGRTAYCDGEPIIFPILQRWEFEVARKKIRAFRNEIKRIEKTLKELNEKEVISGGEITGMPHSSNVSNAIAQYVEVKEKYELALTQRKTEMLEFISDIEKSVMRIGDDEHADYYIVRTIIQLYYIDLLEYEEISKRINYSVSSVFQKLQDYFDKL